MSFYADRSGLDAMISDPRVSIHEVVAEVERLCRREAHAAIYYRDHPDVLFPGHPWLRFVQTGNAGYLGWFPDDH